jgi:hypothetical protein
VNIHDNVYVFEWDADNLRKLVPHKLTPEEVESVLRDDYALPAESQVVDGEERQVLFGMTNTGRILRLIWTLRGERVRIVTAHHATRGQRRRYIRHMEAQE